MNPATMNIFLWNAFSGESAFYYGCFLFEDHFKPDVQIIDVSRQEGTIIVNSYAYPRIGRCA